MRPGLTLVEVVISTMLVALVVAASMNGVASIMHTWRVTGERYDQEGLARRLMSEIVQQRYKEPSAAPLFGVEAPETTQNRSAWDDVDDYHGLSAAPAAKDGTLLNQYANWNWSVVIDFVTISAPTSVSATDTGLKRIRVTVLDPRGRKLTLVGYRSQWGGLEQMPLADSTLQTWVSSRLQVGSESTRLESGVHVLNHARDP